MTLLVLMPWHAPVPLPRAWCLWELLCTIQEASDLVIRLPAAQKQEFRRALLDAFNAVMDVLVRIDVAKAQGWREQDQRMILQAVEVVLL